MPASSSCGVFHATASFEKRGKWLWWVCAADSAVELHLVN